MPMGFHYSPCFSNNVVCPLCLHYFLHSFVCDDSINIKPSNFLCQFLTRGHGSVAGCCSENSWRYSSTVSLPLLCWWPTARDTYWCGKIFPSFGHHNEVWDTSFVSCGKWGKEDRATQICWEKPGMNDNLTVKYQIYKLTARENKLQFLC